MKDETKSIIHLSLEVLRKTLVDSGVSMGMNPSKKQLLFFDTETYFATGKFDGFTVDVESLVK